MKTIAIGLVLIALLAGCRSSAPPPAAQATPASEPETGEVTYSGGDGSSREQAVVIRGAKGEADGVKAEYTWLRRRFSAHRVLRQAVVSLNGRVYDQMDIATSDGNRQSVFFDITFFYGK